MGGRRLNLKDQLYDLLVNEWALTEVGLTASDVEFGRFLKDPEKISKPQVRVVRFDDRCEPLGGSSANFLEGNAYITIHLQFKSVDLTESNLTSAEDNVDKMEDEVRRILAQSTLPSGWIDAYVSRSELSVPTGYPPIIENVVTVRVYYVKTY